MTRIPDCPNFNLMYPGCDKDKDNVFQCININLSKGENKMSVLTESRGWTSHFHALISIICAVVGIYAVVLGDMKVAGIFLFLTLGNIAATLGCIRQKLQAMSK